MHWTLLTLLACGDADPPERLPAPETAPMPSGPSPQGPPPAHPPGPGAQPGHGPGLDQGQKHPPLPADNPIWAWDAGGFVPDVHWYGEASWADVRMRVLGHLAVVRRDQARLAASEGDFGGCQARYSQLAEELAAVSLPAQGFAPKIRGILQRSATRDAAVCGALAAGEAPPQAEGVAGLRARYLGLAQRSAEGEDVTTDARALLSDLEAQLAPREDLDIEGFEDFVSRHELRVRLFEAALDAQDPLGVAEPWGYWTDSERRRQVQVLMLATRRLSEGMLGDKGGLEGPTELGEDPRLWPTELSEQLAWEPARFSAVGLGALPTGDTFIDSGAQPGPKAIGTLERLGMDDPTHVLELKSLAETLNRQLDQDPAGVLPLLTAWTDALDALGHGSRYYNIKQARNEGMRVLAATGRPELALTLLERSYPLHNQDWACPNREGILLGLKGRLLVESEDSSAAEVLESAAQQSLAFLALIDRAERGEDVGVRPPPMREPGGLSPSQPEGPQGMR